MTISRRAFARMGALALVSLGAEPLFLGRAAFAQRALRASAPTGARTKTLVCLFQRGAVDGLSMIVPHGDPFYARERPRIALPRETLVDLDGQFALHPRLAPLKPLWDARALAVVHAVGSPDATRSHFDAQDYMETATPGVKGTRDGWLNRVVAHDRAHAATAFRAVAFGPELPRALAGDAPALAIDDLRTFGINAPRPEARDRLTRAFEALYAGAATGIVARTAEEGFEAAAQLRALDQARYAPANGAAYPDGRLGLSLMQIAQLIKADVGLEIACTDVGGWDTHVNQGSDQGQLAGRLDELGRALAAFTTDLGERLADVVVLTMSEFGRTVKENGTGGTDHGHATAMLVLGGDVRGGRVAGRWPGLAPEARFEGRDLAVTTDFRMLFAELVRGHLGIRDSAAIFPAFASTAPPLGLLG